MFKDILVLTLFNFIILLIILLITYIVSNIFIWLYENINFILFLFAISVIASVIIVVIGRIIN